MISVLRVARRKAAEDQHQAQIALMKFLSKVARKERVGDHVYVVGGAVRNFIIDRPIKDIDVVIDAVALGERFKKPRDSEWFAETLQRVISARTNMTTNQYGVAILTVKGDWMVDGHNLNGEVIEIANARKESYGGAGGKGYKPDQVDLATIEEDLLRREFTFNTLLWRLQDLATGPEKAEIIDLTGCGLRDLNDMTMRCPRDPDIVFSDDPTRMLRAIKFSTKYGFKIPSDLAASIRKNAQKMKQAPWEAIAGIFINNVLNEPTAPSALRQMKSLGLLDVVAEMVQEQKPFATYLSKQLRNRNVSVLLDLLDLGLSDPNPLRYLNREQQQRLREITVPMDSGDADAFAAYLGKPSVDNGTLISDFGLQGSARSLPIQYAREALLENPDLMGNQRALDSAIRGLFRSKGTERQAQRLVSRFLSARSQFPVRVFTVFRTERHRRGGLSNKNAADLKGIVRFLGDECDDYTLSWCFENPPAYITEYEVRVQGPSSRYNRYTGGRISDQADGYGEASGWGSWYSFPAEFEGLTGEPGRWELERVSKSVPTERIATEHPGFLGLGHAEQARILARYF